MTSQRDTCLSTFGTCRKYEDDAGAAISVCSQSAKGLASKLKSLTTNTNLVNQVQATIAARKRKAFGGEPVSSRQQQAANASANATAVLSCAQFTDLGQDMVGVMADNPASTRIATIAGQMINSTEAPCTPDEVTKLNELDGAIDKAEDSLEAELNNTQSDIEGD